MLGSRVFDWRFALLAVLVVAITGACGVDDSSRGHAFHGGASGEGGGNRGGGAGSTSGVSGSATAAGTGARAGADGGGSGNSDGGMGDAGRAGLGGASAGGGGEAGLGGTSAGDGGEAGLGGASAGDGGEAGLGGTSGNGGSAGNAGNAGGGGTAGQPSVAEHHVHIYVDNFCNMDVDPTSVSVPAGQTAFFDWHNHSVDYEVTVWKSYGGGYVDLATGDTWEEPIEHCAGPPSSAYADISTACSNFRVNIYCE